MLAPQVQGKRIKILVLAANPLEDSRGRLDEEIRAIDEHLQRSLYRDLFDIKPHVAVRIDELQRHLLRYEPDIVHFSGYGTRSGEIVLLDGSNGRPIAVAALSNLFSHFKGTIRCVVLNTCYSEKQARAIAKHIDCVVGMSKAITDAYAISFAGSFYQALGYGKDIKTAFELGCQQIDMVNLAEPDLPKLVDRRREAKRLVLTSPQVVEQTLDDPAPPNQDAVPLAVNSSSVAIDPGYASPAPEVLPKSAHKTVWGAAAYVGIALLILVIGWFALGPRKKSTSSFVPPSYANQNDLAQESDTLESQNLSEPAATAIQKTIQLASEAFQRGHYGSAIDTCKNILATNPKQPQAELLLGQSYYSLGNLSGFEYLLKALKNGETITLPIKHHHYDGVLKLDDGLCAGYLRLRAQRVEFHSEEREGHDFSITPGDIYEIRDESQTKGRLSLIINTTQEGINRLEVYNFYSPLASLRKQITRTKVFCTEPPCQTMMQILHKLLRQIKS